MNRSIAGAVLVAAAISGLAAGPAQARTTAEAARKGPTDAEAAARPAKARPGPGTKYCVIEEVTGSRIDKKTCLTKAEWKARGIDIPNS